MTNPKETMTEKEFEEKDLTAISKICALYHSGMLYLSNMVSEGVERVEIFNGDIAAAAAISEPNSFLIEQVGKDYLIGFFKKGKQ